MTGNTTAMKALIHAHPDFVAVATDDIKRNEEIVAVYMEDGKETSVKSREDIPLGHKIALKDVREGEKVIEYGEVIGKATKNIATGDHVHVHNLKSLRW
jgi:(2R)-sulfolactate sulfo-lyase subunit alpha